MKNFSFNNKKNAVFERSEKMIFSFDLEAKDDLNDLKLYFTVRSIDTRVGTTQTFEKFSDVKRGEDYSFTFSLDISNLAPGDYYFIPDIFVEDGTGRHISYEHPICDILFTVVDTKPKGIRWKHYFGKVILNPIIKIDP